MQRGRARLCSVPVEGGHVDREERRMCRSYAVPLSIRLSIVLCTISIVVKSSVAAASSDINHSNVDNIKLKIYASVVDDSLTDISSTFNIRHKSDDIVSRENVLDSHVVGRPVTNNDIHQAGGVTSHGGRAASSDEEHRQFDRSESSVNERHSSIREAGLVSTKTGKSEDRERRRRRRHESRSHKHKGHSSSNTPTDCRPVSSDLLWLRLSLLHNEGGIDGRSIAENPDDPSTRTHIDGMHDKAHTKKSRKNPCRNKKRKNQPLESTSDLLPCENKTQTTIAPFIQRERSTYDLNHHIAKNSEEQEILSSTDVLTRGSRSVKHNKENPEQIDGSSNTPTRGDTSVARRHGKHHRSTTTELPPPVLPSSTSSLRDTLDPSRTREETPSWLCRMESRWERMPPGTFPAYVQTGSCQSQTNCMLGLYECTPRRYNIKVLRRIPDRCFPVPTTDRVSGDKIIGKTAFHEAPVDKTTVERSVNNTGSISWSVGWEQAWKLENHAVIVGCECSRRRRTGSYTPASGLGHDTSPTAGPEENNEMTDLLRRELIIT